MDRSSSIDLEVVYLYELDFSSLQDRVIQLHLMLLQILQQSLTPQPHSQWLRA